MRVGTSPSCRLHPRKEKGEFISLFHLSLSLSFISLSLSLSLFHLSSLFITSLARLLIAFVARVFGLYGLRVMYARTDERTNGRTDVEPRHAWWEVLLLPSPLSAQTRVRSISLSLFHLSLSFISLSLSLSLIFRSPVLPPVCLPVSLVHPAWWL